MEQILTDFGVKPILLAAQIVNFLILFLILKKFFYRPLLRILEERKKRIKNSLRNAEIIKQRLQTTEEESAKKLSAASKEAKIILDTATNTANEIIAKAHQQAQSDIELMVEKGRKNLLQEREIVIQKLRGEYAKSVILGIEKITYNILDQADHKKIIQHQVEKLNIPFFGE